MAKNYEEYVEEQVEQIKADSKEAADQVRSDAEGGRFDQPDTVETEEQYHERLAAVRGAMIFGDTDTTAGATASGTDVPSADNEAATMAVAEAHVQQLEGDVDEDVSSDEARRQVDVSASGLDAEEVDEGAEAQEEGDPLRAGDATQENSEDDAEPSSPTSDAEVATAADDDEEESLTPAQKAARTRARNRAAEGDES